MTGNTVAVVFVLLSFSAVCVYGRCRSVLSRQNNAYNFTCDLTPAQHDRIKQQLLIKLRQGKIGTYNNLSVKINIISNSYQCTACMYFLY